VPFDYQPTLKGELVELRPLRPADYDDLYAVARDPLIWEQHPAANRYQPAVFRTFFDESLASGGALVAADAGTGAVIGSSRFYGYDEQRSEVEIGWTFLARAYWGGRYNGEMKRLMLEHAFRFVRHVVFLVGPQNLRSQRAVERIGAVRAGSRSDASGRESFLYQISRSVVALLLAAFSAAPVFAQATASAHEPADRPMPRTDENSRTAHEELLQKARRGRIDVYFIGDSITRRWGATDYPELLEHWKTNFFGWNAANFGWGADKTQHILWRLENGELDDVNPKVIVVLAGTNNVGSQPGDGAKIAGIARGLAAIVYVCRRKAPDAAILLTGIFPRNDNMAVLPEIDRINGAIARLADGKTVRYLNVNARLADESGTLREGMMHDKLHPTVKGYQVWADALKPILLELLGPPAAVDLAPPPTGDPSARRPGGRR